MAVFREGNRPKDMLPLEHMSLDADLRFFLEIFYNMEVVNYDCEGFFACVMLDNKRKLKLGVNIKALEQFSLPEQLYILAHEGAHIVFNHLLRGERFVNKKLVNIAMDAVLNSIINRHYSQISMPKINQKPIGITLEFLYSEKLIKDEDLELLKKELSDLTTDDVYEILQKNIKEMAQNICPNCGKNMSNPPKNQNQSNNQSQSDDQNQSDNQNQSNNQSQSDDQNQSGKKNTTKCPHCGAEHENSEDSVINKYDKKRIDHHEGITSDDIDDETRIQIEELIRQAKSEIYGNKTGEFIRDLMEAVRKSFPFKEILDKIIYKDRYDFTRENRRIRIKDGYIPRRRREKIKVYAMVDVSGSCYDYTEDFIGYIMALEEFEELILIDTEIKAVYKKGDGIPKVVPGGGGTDLNPGFDHWRDIELTTKGFKLNFICLTDGEIPELTVGPVQSKVLILTTNEEVQNKNSPRRYINIKIEPKE